MPGRWKLLDDLAHDHGPLGIPRPAMSELALRLDEALSTRDRDELSALSGQLGDLLKGAMAAAPKDAADAARGGGSSKDAVAAYRLGQYGFAHLLAANSVGRRVGADFAATLGSETYAPYVAALSHGELTGVELAEAVGRRAETVSRNLRVLREIGAVDFRSDGTRNVNFLTAAARAFGMAEEAVHVRRRPSPVVAAWAADRVKTLDPIMKETPLFTSALELSEA